MNSIINIILMILSVIGAISILIIFIVSYLLALPSFEEDRKRNKLLTGYYKD